MLKKIFKRGLSTEEKDKLVTNLFKQELKKHGFSKKGRHWTRNLDKVIQFLNLQKSAWSWSYYINLGIHIKAMSWGTKPNVNDCSISIRYEHVVPKKNIFKILDLENDFIDMDERLKILDKIINKDIIPFFDSMTNEADIKRVIKSGKYPSEFVTYGLIRNTSKYLKISKPKI